MALGLVARFLGIDSHLGFPERAFQTTMTRRSRYLGSAILHQLPHRTRQVGREADRCCRKPARWRRGDIRPQFLDNMETWSAERGITIQLHGGAQWRFKAAAGAKINILNLIDTARPCLDFLSLIEVSRRPAGLQGALLWWIAARGWRRQTLRTCIWRAGENDLEIIFRCSTRFDLPGADQPGSARRSKRSSASTP